MFVWANVKTETRNIKEGAVGNIDLESIVFIQTEPELQDELQSLQVQQQPLTKSQLKNCGHWNKM